MTRRVSLACRPEIIELPVERILPVKVLTSNFLASPKYHRIAASVRELGVIEPLVVYPQEKPEGAYLLLDGHTRLHVVKGLGRATVECLVANDDEAYTYNQKVNRLSPIQEHFMILRAIKEGVPEARIAKTLNVDVASIARKRDLLVGVCREAVELLKDRRATAGAIRELKRAKPMRQIEMAELMVASGNFTVDYAKCLIVATPADQLVDAERAKEASGLSSEDVARIERETQALEKDFRAIEETYGRNVLDLVVVAGYVRKLLESARAVRFLSGNYPEILAEFQKLAESRSLADAADVA